MLFSISGRLAGKLSVRCWAVPRKKVATSARGYSRRFGHTSAISGLPPTADIWTNAGFRRQSAAGTLIAQNDHDTWTLQTRWPAGVAPEAVDPHALLKGFTGCDFEYEILVANAWTPHLLV